MSIANRAKHAPTKPRPEAAAICSVSGLGAKLIRQICKLAVERGVEPGDMQPVHKRVVAEHREREQHLTVLAEISAQGYARV